MHGAKVVVTGLIVFLVANTIAWMIPVIVICRPISAYWSLQGQRGRCLNYDVLGTFLSLPNLASDIALLILPGPILWKTQLSLTKRLGLILTFAAGSAGVIGACLRLGFYIRRTYVVRPGSDETTGRHVAILKFYSCILTSV